VLKRERREHTRTVSNRLIITPTRPLPIYRVPERIRADAPVARKSSLTRCRAGRDPLASSNLPIPPTEPRMVRVSKLSYGG